MPAWARIARGEGRRRARQTRRTVVNNGFLRKNNISALTRWVVCMPALHGGAVHRPDGPAWPGQDPPGRKAYAACQQTDGIRHIDARYNCLKQIVQRRCRASPLDKSAETQVDTICRDQASASIWPVNWLRSCHMVNAARWRALSAQYSVSASPRHLLPPPAPPGRRRRLRLAARAVRRDAQCAGLKYVAATAGPVHWRRQWVRSTPTAPRAAPAPLTPRP